MLGLCWVPLMIVGGNYALQTDWHHSEHITAPFVEVQTCRDGFQANAAYRQMLRLEGLIRH